MPSGKKSEQLIYCGPNLPQGILNQFTVYRNGLPGHLEEHLENCPAIVRLFVPVTDLAETMEAIKKAGTAENSWFRQVVKYIQGGVR